MSLYLDFRPSTFDQIKGNGEIVNSLKKFLSNKATCPHVYLFHGPTGCGKTTFGRIIASELGCVGIDLNEINSADFRGIDTARDIIQNCKYRPVESPVKVYIIDECHKLTNDAQNALLKILEDTPKHVFFIFCTTEVNKVITAFQNRCQIYQVNALNDNQLTGLLRQTARKVNESVEPEVLEVIVRESLGYPRSALNILEQVLSVPKEQRIEIAKRTAAEQIQSIELCRALINRNSWKTIRTILKGLSDQEPESIRRQVLGYCQSVLLNDDNLVAGLIMEMFKEPFYNIGFPGLVLACYSVVHNE